MKFPTKDQLKHGMRVNFKIIIPSTRDKDIHIGKKAFEKRVKLMGNFLARRFQGATIDYGFGSYKLDGKIITENVSIISVFTTQETYNKHDIELRNEILKRKHSWGQDSIGFEYQEELLFI